ncbi:MAG: hypothetical protein GY821_01725 [Gammaproteobacteria bacterium]|nr:hypothetical protein [Gammaproteobacteria bacterium]
MSTPENTQESGANDLYVNQLVSLKENKIVYGFIRENSTQYIPNDVTNLACSFYTSPKSLDVMASSSNANINTNVSDNTKTPKNCIIL